jgi:NAD(P)-dependent dehydrogenase (short-subunit alcohol dehydrogenase family)
MRINDLRKAIVGAVEELGASQRALDLTRDQFETNYFGPVNILRAALPHMRRQRSGHIVVLSGISMTQRLFDHRMADYY